MGNKPATGSTSDQLQTKKTTTATRKKHNTKQNNTNNNIKYSTLKQAELQIFSKEDLCIIDNLGEFCQGDQLNITGIDLSKSVQNAYKLYPFNSIGRVISIFPSLQIEKQQDFPYGTGTIISQKVIITSAHNLYHKNSKLRAKYVFFQPQSQNTKSALIKVKRYAIHKSFFDSQNKNSQAYDMAILILEQNQQIKPQMVMPLKFGYKFSRFKQNEILISGYPKEKNLSNRFLQFFQSNIAVHQRENFLLYKHYTSSGHSGSPVLLKDIDENGDESYYQIGVHKGSTGVYNFCVLLSQEENSFIDLLKKISITSGNEIQLMEEKRAFLQKLLQQLQVRQSKGVKSRWYTEIDGIRWSRENKNQCPIQNYLAQNQQRVKTFSSQLQQIVDNLQQLQKESMLMSIDVWKYIIQRVKHLKLSQQQETEYLEMLMQFVQINMNGKTIVENEQIQQDQQEFRYCGQMGQRLFEFWNKVYYKTSEEDLTHQIQVEQTPISIQSQTLINSIVSTIKKGFSPNNINNSKRQQKRYQCQLKFYLSNKNLQKALILSNTKIINQKQTPNTFWLKAEIMRQAGYLSRALIYYNKCLQQEERTYSNLSTNYATTLNNIGLVYKNESDYQTALQYYNKSLAIQQKINGEQSIKTIPTRNNIALILNQKGQTQKAIYMLNRCLNIQKLHLPSNHIDIATTLHNIALINDDIQNHQKALEFYEQCLKIKQHHYGKDSIHSCSTLNNIGMVYWNMQCFDKAFVYFMKCLQLQQRVYGTQNYNSIVTINNIASVYRELNRLDEAIKYYKKALSIKQKIKGKTSSQSLKTYQTIASIYKQHQKYKQSIQYYNKCIQAQIVIYGEKSLQYAETNEKLANIYLKMDDKKQANQKTAICYNIRLQSLGKNHQLTKKAYKLLKSTK